MTYRRPKIALIGGGQIGAVLALLSGLKEMGDIVIHDIVEGMPQGKALDLSQIGAVEAVDFNIFGTNNLKDIEGADVVIITAGLPRKPGMSRDDLVITNSAIIKTAADGVKKYAPNAFVICITNPIDVMVQVFCKRSMMPPNKVVGMAGILDAARFRSFLAHRLKVSMEDVHALVLGGHGDSMVPLPRYCTVGGIPLPDLIQMGIISEAEVDAIVERTRNGGGEIVELLKTGSAYFTPAAAAMTMVEAYLKDKKRLLPCCAYLTGEYNVNDLYVGVPCIIGGGGVEKILELPLLEKELINFNKSVDVVKKLLKNIQM